mmetsp:Transcript_92266/g.232041  ORF Transcript_92266/g.232041 Transcript_92266/m.232041 type:complete len:106 (+) Transcript_92266:50-367(+)
MARPSIASRKESEFSRVDTRHYTQSLACVERTPHWQQTHHLYAALPDCHHEKLAGQQASELGLQQKLGALAHSEDAPSAESDAIGVNSIAGVVDAPECHGHIPGC